MYLYLALLSEWEHTGRTSLQLLGSRSTDICSAQPKNSKTTRNMAKSTKIKFFRACVERAEMRTTSKELEKRLDGTYTRLLMPSQNLSWKNHPTKTKIYGEFPPISKTVAQRRARFAGHCFRAKDQVIFNLLLLRLPCPRWGNRPLT